jgi:aminocarboxymuconate-semialdehyde decarboxylase
MIVDCHGHLVPPPLIEAIRREAGGFPSLRVIEEGGSIALSFAGGKPTRPIAKGLFDIDARRKWLAERGIDRQVVGGWLDMFGYQLPAEEGTRWSQLINEHMAALRSGRHFVPLATLPMQDGAAAAKVLRDAHAAGFKGAMIGTQPSKVGSVLDDPSLDPFWKAADDLGSILFIHPVFYAGDDRVNAYGMANAVGRITDSLISVSRLIYSGHVARYGNARIIVGIGGAALPYVIGRLRRNYQLDRDKLGDPDAALKSFYYDALLHDHRAVRFLADVVGVDRIMMGSDMPFPIGDPDPMKVISEAGFGDAERASINGALAQKLFAI